MVLKKYFLLFFLLIFCIAAGLSAQAANDPAAADTEPAGSTADTAQQDLKEISVSRFEDAGSWTSFLPSDYGLVKTIQLEGAPMEKTEIDGEQQAGIDERDIYVLGNRVDFFRRGITSLSIRPARPLRVEGISQMVSVWVVGRNMQHTLSLVVSDYFGNKEVLRMGSLNFTGWKQMTVAIPDTLVQRDAHYNRTGMQIEGFMIDFDLVDTYGSYYVYFDDLRVQTDLFSITNRDVDDMQDNW